MFFLLRPVLFEEKEQNVEGKREFLLTVHAERIAEFLGNLLICFDAFVESSRIDKVGLSLIVVHDANLHTIGLIDDLNSVLIVRVVQDNDAPLEGRRFVDRV